MFTFIEHIANTFARRRLFGADENHPRRLLLGLRGILRASREGGRARGQGAPRPSDGGLRLFRLDQALLEAVSQISEQDQRTEDEVVSDLIASGLARRREIEDYEQSWARLTEREKQVAALLCQEYAYDEIAELLSISPETVRSHTHHALIKFNLRRKEDLQRALAHWDFADFIRPDVI
jgi:DNA-binding CsgD family transcriptional regulator